MSIFLSHTHADKALVEPIAERLAQAFGRDTVFYDNWSIQPGDGIVDKMNEALGECRFFFFFVSKNSLPSKMVQLEWQNALVKSMKGEARIIPVKLDDCLMPAVLLQTLYIDYSGYGPENAIRQMVDVISGASTYRPGAPAAGFHNVLASTMCELICRRVAARSRWSSGPTRTWSLIRDTSSSWTTRNRICPGLLLVRTCSKAASTLTCPWTMGGRSTRC